MSLMETALSRYNENESEIVMRRAAIPLSNRSDRDHLKWKQKHKVAKRKKERKTKQIWKARNDCQFDAHELNVFPF